MKYSLKISFKCGKTSVAQLRELFQFKIIAVIIRHYSFQRYRARLIYKRAKVGQQLSITGVIGYGKDQLLKL